MLKRLLALILLSPVFAVAGCDSGRDAVEKTPQGVAAEDVKADFSLALGPAQMEWVGRRIFQNECSGEFQCLVHWNEGEAFPSLGIGHFIWYPEGVDGRFVESFPKLIQFMVSRQAPVPQWLQELEPFDAPWPDKPALQSQEDSRRVVELREFLANTQGIQAEFIFRRAQASLNKIVMAAPEDRREQTLAHLESLSSTPGGIYALMDYVNFKGEGLSVTERYEGQGWGLLQVILAMKPDPDTTPLKQFRDAAARVLTQRANNAENPIEKQRWLVGWLKRLETYSEPEKMDSPTLN